MNFIKGKKNQTAVRLTYFGGALVAKLSRVSGGRVSERVESLLVTVLLCVSVLCDEIAVPQLLP